MEKRYALVRVDRYPICPLGFKHKCEDFVKTGICDCKHGDSKEQMVKKVAQVRYKQEIKNWILWNNREPNKKDCKVLYQNALKQAKEIIEFLGVEG